MYADSTDVKDTNVKARISTKQKNKLKEYIRENNQKSISDFIVKLIDKELNEKGQTLFS